MRYIVIFVLIIVVRAGVLPSTSIIFSEWGNVLKRHVTPSRIHGVAVHVVDYEALKQDADYLQLLARMNAVSPASLQGRKEKLAFWINAYNIAAIKMVTDNYPLKSIRDKSTIFTSVWNRKIISINGVFYSLGHIEHTILRKMNDPRIHFAIVCASVSCPDIRKESYTAMQLDEQMDDQVRVFLHNNGKGLHVDNKHRVIYVSKIFQWFKKDFKNIRTFIAAYRPDLRLILVQKKYTIAFLDYDWALNKK